MTAVGDVIAAHRRLAFDSNLFTYLFEAGGAEARVFASILNEAESAGVSMIVSSLTLAEVSVGPSTVLDDVMADRYADAIRSIRGLVIVPLTADVAVDAGLLRGRSGCSQADAIHLATARQAGATAFITNDRRLRSLPKLEVIQLGDLMA